MTIETTEKWISQRFRGYLPVVVDIETGGFNSQTDAILQIGVSILTADEHQKLKVAKELFYEITPFAGSNLEKSALQFTGIDPSDESREAIDEKTALKAFFSEVRTAVKAEGCKRAILTGHNAFFDLGFLNAAITRTNQKRSPFHPFSTLDTVSLGALYYNHTVLAKCCEAAEIDFDNNSAHNAAYDANKTAELFCKIINHYEKHSAS